jgi:threonine dehydrogenase-like Zn-dependent dehydrogenase
MGFPAREAFFKDLSLKMGICNARNYITPLMPLKDTPHGYAIFDRKEDRAIKVTLKP